MDIQINEWKHSFPIFSLNAHPDLCYLDSAATCLTPKPVAEAIYYYQCYSHANSHKGLYQLSANATEIVENARDSVATFIGAKCSDEIIFTSGTTESINLIAMSYLAPKLTKHANIVISALEHHANLLPWQRLSKTHQVQLRIAPLTISGEIDIAALAQLLDSDTALLALSHVSNVLGAVNPIEKAVKLAQKNNIPVLVDGAQAVAHHQIDVQQLGCDFYVFSAHKVYGPTGCGVLYAKENVFDEFIPYNVGGGIVEFVNTDSVGYLAGGAKLEPGSRNVASIVGLSEAIDFINDISWQSIYDFMQPLNRYLRCSLQDLPEVSPLIDFSAGSDDNMAPPLVSFQLANVHPHDVASILDAENVAVRAGHHCAQPLHQKFGVNASIRASLGLYNNSDDIDRLCLSLHKAHQLLAR